MKRNPLVGTLVGLRKRAARLLPARGVHPLRVLIVDDDPAICEFVQRVLRRAGYVTETAANALDALSVIAHRDAFDLLLTDVVMPRMMGDELARRVRDVVPSIKVLYLTGHRDRLLDSKTSLDDREALLEKPATADRLLDAVSLLTRGCAQKTVWT